MRTKLFALVSALFLSAQLFAQDFVVDGIYYNFLSGDSVEVTSSGYYSANTYSGAVTIPATVDFESMTYQVTSIGERAFSGCVDLTSVNLPNSIVTIGDQAFRGCTGLTTLSIPESIVTIGDNAFNGCTGLTTLSIPESVTTIGLNAFYNLYSLTSVVWEAINCSVESYMIPFGGDNLYDDATGESIPWESQVTSFTFGENVIQIPARICENMQNLTNVTIPNSVTTIGEKAFYKSGLTSITIPQNVTAIGNEAFYYLNALTSVVWNAQNYPSVDQVGRAVTIFGGDGSYDDATGQDIPWESQVTSFTFGEDVTQIPAGICENMQKLTSVSLSNNVTTIGTEAFYKSGLTAITIPQSVTTIGEKAFYNLDALTSVVWNAPNCSSVDSWGRAVTIFSGDESYGEDIPWESQVSSFTFGESVTQIPAGICANMQKLTSVSLSNNVTTIGTEAFYNSGLTAITIPQSVTTIGEKAFYNSGLTSITIPQNVTAIGNEAFYYLNALTSVVWNAQNYPSVDQGGRAVTIFGGNGSYDSTGQYIPWASPVTSFTFGENVIQIPAGICANMQKLTNIAISEGATSIGQEAFRGCTNLSAISLPASVIEIGGEAFYNCSNLTELTIPANVESIGSNAFYNCSGITSLTIPASLQYIGRAAFYNCTNLTSITWNAINCSVESQIFERTSPSTFTFGNEVESIPEYLCSGFDKLTSIHIPEKVKTIGYYAFNSCDGLTSIDIPNSVTAIGSYAFCNSSNLQSIVIGTGLDSVGYEPFAYCDNLRKFVCHSTKSFKKIDSEYNPYPGALENANLDTIVAPAVFFDYPESSWSDLAKNIRYIQVNSGELTADAFSVINRSFDKLQTLDIAAATNTEIANNAFKGCYKLENLRLPAQLEYIGYMALADCKSLQSVEIPATVTDIDDSAFENCRSIKKVTFANGGALERIGNWAFYNCHEIQHLSIPEGVTEIGSAAFYGCVYLQDITLPSTLKMMGDNSFALCSKLQKITSLATVPPTIEAKTFYEVSRSTPLYVPKASLTAYEGDMYWKEFMHIQAAPDVETGLEQVDEVTGTQNGKILENGQVIIIRDGVRYNVLGVRL